MRLRLVAIVMLTSALAVSSWAQGEDKEREYDSVAEALQNGKGAVSLRFRHELVSAEAFAREANALTLRTSLSYRSARYKGFDLFLEAVDVTALDDALYQNGGAGVLANGPSDRPKVVDPELTQINQAYLRFRGGDTEVVAGREEILWNDQRFVGNVGWRQNHQSFESARIVNRSIERVTLNYAFLRRVHRVTGANQPMTSHLFNAAIKVAESATFTLYAYLLDFDDAAQWALSTNTFGGEFVASTQVDATKIHLEVEFADQADAAKNPLRIDDQYINLMVAASQHGVSVKAGWERLRGEVRGFNTTLGTNHKFNGWADKFLVTPLNGLEDVYAGVMGKRGRFDWQAVYHNFSSDDGSKRYGGELDLKLGYKSPWNQVFAAKAALYDADEFSKDTDKLWMWTSYSF